MKEYVRQEFGLVEKHHPPWFHPAICPDCDQGSALVYIACPGCGRLALFCTEVGWPAYPQLEDLTIQVDVQSPCVGCREHAFEIFPWATDQQIRDAGVGRADYC